MSRMAMLMIDLSEEQTAMIAKIIEAHPFRVIQSFCAFLDVLKKTGITNEQFLLSIDEHRKRMRSFQWEQQKAAQESRKHFLYNVRRCPVCGEPMGLMIVNDKPCNQIGGSYKSMWFCFDQYGCGHTIASYNEAYDEAKTYNLEKFYKRFSPENIAEVKKRRRASQRQNTRRQAQPPQNKRPCCK